MDDHRRKIVRWVGTEVMPHERGVRLWLTRSGVPEGDVDDLIQEAYCRMSALDSVDHIARPDSYFFQIARNLLIEQVRRSRIIRFETAAALENLSDDDHASPERITAGRRELERVQGLISGLPERCRRIFELRKIHGLSQKEIAARLGVTESVVENDGAKGLRLILKGLRQAEHSRQDKDYADEQARNSR